ncbi:MAG: FAD-binding protein, partial [Desulfobacterales bacterium]
MRDINYAFDLNQFYDVLVVGGGNAALCAAMTARENRARVLLGNFDPVPAGGH